jgi:hypothetical protein
MTKKTNSVLAALALCLLGTGTSHATLIDRGGGLIYDDVLNVTWMQDIQYAYTSGANPWPVMNWTMATEYVSNLDYWDSVRGVMISDWRLPSTINAPSSDGWDTTGLSSELAYMYYINLGYQAQPGDRTLPAPSSTNYNPFLNMAYRAYWSGTNGDLADRAWYLHFHFGFQRQNTIGDGGLYVWAVRDGDVAALGAPEPGTLALFGVALVGLGLANRRRKKLSV